MTLDSALLTDIKVRRHDYGNHHLKLRFKGLSDIYVPHLKTYRTTFLSDSELKEFLEISKEETIDNKPNPLYPYRDTIRVFDEFQNVVQFDAPANKSRDFQTLIYDKRAKQYSLEEKVLFEGKPERRSGRQIIKTDQGDKEARWNLGTEDDPLRPGVIYNFEDPLLHNVLSHKRDIEKTAAELRLKLRSAVPLHMQTRIFNMLRESFLKHQYPIALEKLQHSAYTKEISADIKNLARSLVEQEKTFTEFYRNYGEFRYEKDKKRYSLYANKRPNFTYQRQLSLDEWMNMTYALIDIETPKFIENDYEVSQVAVTLVRNQEIIGKRTYSIQKTARKEVHGVEIISGFDNDAEMIEHMSDWLTLNGAEVLMAYNNKFDFSHLRERGNFTTGDAMKEPVMDVSKAFFERFDIESGFCIDLLRLAQTMLRGYPNAKLVTFSNLLFGDESYEKPINYQEMYELQLLSEGREISVSESTKSKLEKFVEDQGKKLTQKNERLMASEMIVDYVCQDTHELYRCYFQSDDVRRKLEYVQKMAELFRVNFVKLISSPEVLTEFFDQGFFKHLGYHREDIYPKGIKFFDDERKRNKDAVARYFDEAYGFDSKKKAELNGTVHDVQRRLVSGALHVKHYKHYATDRIQKFFNWIEGLYEEGIPQEDIVFVSRYANALLGYVFNDFGNYQRKKKVYETLVKEFKKIRNIDPFKMDQIVKHILDSVQTRSGEISKGEFIALIKSLKKPETFDANIELLNEDFLKELKDQNLSYEDIYRIFWSIYNFDKEWTRISGNHRILPQQLESIIKNSANQVQKEFEESLIAVEYPVAFTRGTIKPSVLLPLQTEIEGGIYFSKGKAHYIDLGWYRGVEKTDVATHRTTSFESQYFVGALNAFLESDYRKGLAHLREAERELQKLIGRELTNEQKMQFLRFTKSQKWYEGFMNGESYLFTIPETHTITEKQGIKGIELKISGKKQFAPIIEEEEGNYFEITLRNKKRKVHIHGFEKFIPDIQAYYRYFRKKRNEFAKGAEIAISQKQTTFDLEIPQDTLPFDFEKSASKT